MSEFDSVRGLVSVEMYVTKLDTGETYRYFYPQVRDFNYEVDIEQEQFYSDSLLVVSGAYKSISMGFSFKPMTYTNDSGQKLYGTLHKIAPGVDRARKVWYDEYLRAAMENGERNDRVK